MRKGLHFLTFITCVSIVAAMAQSAETPTFSKDVAPILYKNCVSCHRPGEMAPMSLLTYEQARPFARSIRERSRTGHDAAMARGSAGRHIPERAAADCSGKGNPRAMGQQRRAGGRSQRHAAGSLVSLRVGPSEHRTLSFTWRNLTTSRPPVTIPYQFFQIPTNFTEDKWVQAIEIRPGVRSVVHHVLVFASEPGGTPRQQPFVQRAGRRQRPRCCEASARACGSTARTCTDCGDESRTAHRDDGARNKRPALPTRQGDAHQGRIHPDPADSLHRDGQSRKGSAHPSVSSSRKSLQSRRFAASAFVNAQLTIPPGADNHRVDSRDRFQSRTRTSSRCFRTRISAARAGNTG